ncbi:MAG: hypothetical protein AABY38_02930 [Planctomycetota bacterium]|nr:MAG: hypothetical protein A3G70_08560 [Planctomycetes bacterium RIFCSPLOWO2_12_FULL_39_13]
MFTRKYNSKTASTHLAKSKTRSDIGNVYTYRTKTRKTKGKLDSIFNAITDPIIVFDAEFNVININKAAKEFFIGHPIGKKCFFTKHKFALACKNCPTWQTLKSGKTTTSEILSPKTSTLLLLKTYPIYNRLKNIKGAVLIGRESNDVTIKRKK